MKKRERKKKMRKKNTELRHPVAFTTKDGDKCFYQFFVNKISGAAALTRH